MRAIALSILLLMSATLCAAASGASLAIVRTSPLPNAALPAWGTLWVEVAYTADQPVRIHARGFANGASLDQGQSMNASVVHPAGSGSALVWVSYSEAAQIDEIRITVSGEASAPLLAISMPASARWTANPASKPAEPPIWATKLMDMEQQLADAYRAAHPPVDSPFDALLFAFMYISVPGYVITQIWALWHQRGGWRIAAMLPLAVMTAAGLHATLALAAGSNIWPIIVLFSAPLAFIYLLILLAASRMRNLSAFA